MYPKMVWRMPADGKKIYLTFDDGPHPVATPFVLNQLAKYGAKATFFCIGKNVVSEPAIYERIVKEGHVVGNHTQHHLNGWKTDDTTYLSDIEKAREQITSHLFRPPYGRMKRSQVRKLKQQYPQTKIIMWDVLSADFDTNLTPEASLSYVLYHARPGSIVLFHDSDKAWNRMSVALPKVLQHFAEEGYSFEAIC